MGNSIFRRLFIKKEVLIIIMGLDAVGKTTCLYQMKQAEGVTTIPKKGFEFDVETVYIKNIGMTAWGVGGRDMHKLRVFYRHYYPNTPRGLMYVIDSNDHVRLDEALDTLRWVVDEDYLDGIPVLILANKQDLPNALSPLEIASKCTSILSNRCQWKVYVVSATSSANNNGLLAALGWLVSTVETQEKHNIAENWIQAWYPASKHDSTGDDEDEKTSNRSANKKSFLTSFIEFLKIMFKW